MKNWKNVKLGDIGTWGSGGTPLVSKPEYYNGSIPWLIIEDLNDNFVNSSQKKITELGLKNSSTKLVEKGTLLIAMYGSIGKLGIANIKCCTNQAIAFCQPNHKIDVKYLFYYLLFSRSQLTRIGRGGTQQNINQEILKEFEIPLPPLEEQKRIAEILSKCDNIRRIRKYSLQVSDTYLQSVFLEMFGDSEMNWEKTTLDEISEIQGGLQISGKRNNLELNLPYLRVANVYRNYLDLSEIKNMFLTKDELERVALKKDDILIVEGHGNAEEIGRCAIWDGSIKICVHQNHLIRVRPNKKFINSFYLSYYINNTVGKNHFHKSSNTTSGLNTISTGIVKSCKVNIPPLALQEKFAKIVEKFERFRSQQQEAQHQADHLFQTLLHQAFTGKL